MIEKIQIVHRDFKESLESMPIESVGRLTLALFKYANDEDPSEVLNGDQIAGTFFPTLKAHIERQEDFRRSRAENGKKGGGQFGNSNAKKLTKNEQKRPKTSKNEQKRTPIPNPIPSPIPNPYIKEIVSFLNEKTGKHFKECKETERLINGRISEGYTVEDFKNVIDKKVKEWKNDSKMSAFLRPSTLFAPSHFDEYLNAPEGTTNALSGRDSKNLFNRYSQKTDYDFDAIEKKMIRN